MGRNLALLLLVACGEKQTPAAPVDTAAPFRVDVTPPTLCLQGTTCEATIALVALGGFKVNADYPFKFVGDPGPQIAFEGTGSFTHADKQRGTLTIKFRPTQAGPMQVSGTFKLSVCTDEVCKIEQPKITFDVPVT